MRLIRLLLGIVIWTCGGLLANLHAQTILAILPVMQQTPSWCWLATGEMIFKYYHIPPNAPNYQCGEARGQGANFTGLPGQLAVAGPCWANCLPCATFLQASMSLVPLTQGQIKAEIDAGHPIICRHFSRDANVASRAIGARSTDCRL
jgi:hypothetical protein